MKILTLQFMLLLVLGVIHILGVLGHTEQCNLSTIDSIIEDDDLEGAIHLLQRRALALRRPMNASLPASHDDAPDAQWPWQSPQVLQQERQALLIVYLCVAIFGVSVLLLFVATEGKWSTEPGWQADKLTPAEPKDSTRFLELPHVVLQDILQDSEDQYLLATDDRKPLTYRQLRAFIKSPEADCSRYGVSGEDRLAVILGNVSETVVAFWTFTAQCVFVPLDHRLPDEEIFYMVEELSAKAILVKRALYSWDSPFCLDADGKDTSRIKSCAVIECIPHPSLVGLFSLKGVECPVERQAPNRNSVALILMTSGTTKKPKIVPLTHQNLILNAFSVADNLQLKPTDRALSFTPFHHIGGINHNIISAAASNSSVIFTPRMEPTEIMACIDKYHPTWYYGTPTAHILLMRDADPQPGKLRCIRSAAAALDPSVAVQMNDFWCCDILPSYGMTECAPITGHQYGQRVLPASVGPPASPEMIVDETGEILVRGPAVFSGYEVNDKDDENPNLGAWSDGWFRTGDCGHVDHKGYLFVTGRFKEIIIRGGENISPSQVEASLVDDRIEESMAFAVTHEELGEVVGLAVKTSVPDKQLDNLLSSLLGKSKLDYKWQPELIVKVEELPKGNLGKLKRIGMQRFLGLPCRSLENAHPTAYSFWNGRLHEVLSVKAVEEQMIDSLGLVRAGDGMNIPREEKDVLMAIYAVSAFAVVCSNMTLGVVFPINTNPVARTLVAMQSGFIAGGVCWPLLAFSMCAAYLQCKEPLQPSRPIVAFVIYCVWAWPWVPLSDRFLNWSSGASRGMVDGTWVGPASSLNNRWYLGTMTLQYLLFIVGRKLPHRCLQCFILLGICILNLIYGSELRARMPRELQYIFGEASCLCVLVYFFTGHYGRDIIARCKVHPLVASERLQRRLILISQILCFAMMFCLLFFGSVTENRPAIGKLGRPPFFVISRWQTVFDFIASIVFLAFLTQAVRPVASWLAPIGRCALGIYVSGNFFCYAPSGGNPPFLPGGIPANPRSFTIIVKGATILSLQRAVEETSIFWPAQVTAIFFQALLQILLLGVPVQWLYNRTICYLDKVITAFIDPRVKRL